MCVRYLACPPTTLTRTGRVLLTLQKTYTVEKGHMGEGENYFP
jgi:hypothetical protein